MNEVYYEQRLYIRAPLPNRVFSFLVIIMMLGNVYLFPFFKSLDMGEVLVMTFIPYFLIKTDRLTISKEYSLIYLFIIYSLLTTMAMCALLDGDIGTPLVRMIRDFFYYFVIFFLGTHFFDMKSFKKILVYFCVILSTFIILQVLVYTISGYLIPGLLMNAPLNDGGYTGAQLYSNYIRYASIAGYLKPNGFLCEPAHCAQCLFVAILVLLFDEKCERNDIKIAFFISIGMALTMSTSAMLYLMFAWGIWCIKEGKKNFIKILAILFFVSVLGIVAIKNGQLDNVSVVIQRFTKTISGEVVTNSSELRMMKGFSTFLALPLLQQVFGIGFGNYSAAISSIISNVEINMLESEYMNTVAYILVSSGVIGFILIILFFVYVYRCSYGMSRIMIIALLIMSLGSSVYSSPIWIWAMLLILYSGREVQRGNGRCVNFELHGL